MRSLPGPEDAVSYPSAAIGEYVALSSQRVHQRDLRIDGSGPMARVSAPRVNPSIRHPGIIVRPMRCSPASGDPSGLGRALAYVGEGPLASIAEGTIREELAAHRFRPEWMWLAEDDDGEILARALWWGRSDSTQPLALDDLHVRPQVVDPAGLGAALLVAGHTAFGNRPQYNVSLPSDWRSRPEIAETVRHRVEAGNRAGLTREIERLRYEWTPASGTAKASDRLIFTEGTDDDFLDSIPAHIRGQLGRAYPSRSSVTADPAELARDRTCSSTSTVRANGPGGGLPDCLMALSAGLADPLGHTVRPQRRVRGRRTGGTGQRANSRPPRGNHPLPARPQERTGSPRPPTSATGRWPPPSIAPATA